MARQWEKAQATAAEAVKSNRRQSELFTTAPDADDERSEWTAEEQEAEEAAAVEAVTAAAEAESPRDATAEALWRREQPLLDRMQEIAESVAAPAGRQGPPPHRLDPREPLPGSPAFGSPPKGSPPNFPLDRCQRNRPRVSAGHSVALICHTSVLGAAAHAARPGGHPPPATPAQASRSGARVVAAAGRVAR